MTRRALLGFAFAALVASDATAGVEYQNLFRIERSKNANIVRYDAALASESSLDPKRPVVAYWVLNAEDGRREGLSGFDKRAYGFKVAPEQNGSWLLYMKASPDRAIRVVHWQGRWVAQIVISGRSAVLERFYVQSDESGLIPSVRWIDLYGTDMATGKPLKERIKP